MNEENKLEPSSWEEWVEEMADLPEEEQAEQILHKLREQQDQIRTLSSDKSKLTSFVRELQSKNQELNDKLVKQNETEQMMEALNKRKNDIDIELEKVNVIKEKNWINKQILNREKQDLDETVEKRVRENTKTLKKQIKMITTGIVVIEILLYILIFYGRFYIWH